MSRQELAPRVKDLIVRRLKLEIDPGTMNSLATRAGVARGSEVMHSNPFE